VGDFPSVFPVDGAQALGAVAGSGIFGGPASAQADAPGGGGGGGGLFGAVPGLGSSPGLGGGGRGGRVMGVMGEGGGNGGGGDASGGYSSRPAFDLPRHEAARARALLAARRLALGEAGEGGGGRDAGMDRGEGPERPGALPQGEGGVVGELSRVKAALRVMAGRLAGRSGGGSGRWWSRPRARVARSRGSSAGVGMGASASVVGGGLAEGPLSPSAPRRADGDAAGAEGGRGRSNGTGEAESGAAAAAAGADTTAAESLLHAERWKSLELPLSAPKSQPSDRWER
jgi:hypothetical protein